MRFQELLDQSTGAPAEILLQKSFLGLVSFVGRLSRWGDLPRADSHRSSWVTCTPLPNHCGRGFALGDRTWTTSVKAEARTGLILPELRVEEDWFIRTRLEEPWVLSRH